MNEVLPVNPPENSQLYGLSADSARVVQSPARYPEVQQVVDRFFNQIMSNPNPDMDALLEIANEEINQILAR